MSQGVVMDITAQITGYQSSLNTLKTEIDKINIGSSIGKKLKAAFEQATKQVQDLNKAANTRATNDNQIDALFDKANRAGEAILKIVELLQSVKTSDLDFSKFGEDFGKIQKEIENLSDALNAKILVGLRETIASSDELSKVFKDIVGIDASKATTTELFDALNKKSQEATANIADTQKQIDSLNSKIDEQTSLKTKLESGPLGSIVSRDALQAQARELENAYNDIFAKLRQKMQYGLSEMYAGDLNKEDLLNSFFQGLTPENIKQKIIELYNSFTDVGLYKDQKRQFYYDLFGFGNDINDVVKKINLGDPQPIIDKFTELINSVASQIGGSNASKIKELINQGDIEAATNKTVKDFEAGYNRVQNAVQRSVDKVAELTEKKGALTESKSNEETIQSLINAATAELQKELEKVKENNANLLKEIEALKAKNETTKTNTTQQIRDTALKSGSSAQELRLSTEEANKYKTALQQVQEREQLVGKIQGVVQRWFSIYAAVRMVTNAIKSVISTVKELDKTITEIAIVTDKTQDDLWKQMSSYTEMARQYASSISGVYKVSQLYYQQGLQTADVMALTEQTLKMARISGLDYAEATNYMTNAVRSFKMEMTDAQRVVDVYSEIAASSATSTSELAVAMSKTASSAESVGASFENTTAMMAVMIEATRESATNIGSAMKSIISRYGEMKTDPSKLVDSEGEAMSLNKVDKALQSVGITIQDTNHQFRDFDDVIMELAGKWDTIDKNTQRYIATVMAGNRLIMLAVA